MFFPQYWTKGRSNIKKKEQCLRINLKEDPSCLDPRRGRNMAGASHVHAMLFEGLMRLEDDGSLTCAQAHSYSLSEDQQTYTFHLRDTFWSDGTPVTAYDFEKTWKDILNPSFPSLDAQALFCIKNAQAIKQGQLESEQAGIHALDAKTLVVELERPTFHFLHVVASSSLFPINQTQERLFPEWYLEASDHFVCNGPFKVTIWHHHHELVLEKNKYYRQADKIKLDSIHFSMINNGIASLQIHDSGLFDLIGLPFSPLPFDLYRELAQKKLLHIVKTPGTVLCMFNTKRFPFHNIHMRKAFSYAINRQKLIDTVTLFQEEPALGTVPPIVKKKQAKPFFQDDNLAAARAHFQKGLEELGITARDLDGKIAFSFWKHDHGSPLLPQALKQQWLEKLGVDVALEALDFNTLHENGQKGNFSMGYFVHISMYYDPIELLGRFKHALNPRNYTRWENEAYIALLNRSEQSLAQEEHDELLEQAESLLMNEMPFSPLFYWNFAFLVQPHIKGFAVSPFGYLCFDRIYMGKKRSHPVHKRLLTD